LSKLKQSSIM